MPWICSNLCRFLVIFPTPAMFKFRSSSRIRHIIIPYSYAEMIIHPDIIINLYIEWNLSWIRSNIESLVTNERFKSKKTRNYLWPDFNDVRPIDFDSNGAEFKRLVKSELFSISTNWKSREKWVQLAVSLMMLTLAEFSAVKSVLKFSCSFYNGNIDYIDIISSNILYYS